MSEQAGPVFGTDVRGVARVRVGSALAVFPGHTVDAVAAAFEGAAAAVFDILHDRWSTIRGATIPLAALIELAQRIALRCLYFHNVNYGRLEMRLDGRRSDLKSPRAYSEVQDLVSRTLARQHDEHDVVCAVLLGINVDAYRRWACGNDRHANR